MNSYELKVTPMLGYSAFYWDGCLLKDSPSDVVDKIFHSDVQVTDLITGDFNGDGRDQR